MTDPATPIICLESHSKPSVKLPCNVHLKHPLCQLIDACRDKMLVVQWNERADQTIESLATGLESGTIKIGVQATEHGLKVVDTLKRMQDDLEPPGSYKDNTIAHLLEELKNAQLNHAQVVEDLTAQVRNRDHVLFLEREERRSTVAQMERDIAKARRELGDARWREITGEE